MTRTDRSPIEARVQAIWDDFNSADASAPWLLCDRHRDDAVAFRFVTEGLEVRDVTFAQLELRSRQMAEVLRSNGVGEGDRVASLLGKGPDLPPLILAIWRLGAVYVPIFTAFAATAVAERIASSDARVVVTDRDQLSKLDGTRALVMLANAPLGVSQMDDHLPVDLGLAAERATEYRGPSPSGSDTPIVHMFTSGTTGRPKTVVHPLSYIAGWQSYLEMGLSPGDRYWCGADPGWAYGLYTAIVAPLSAAVPSIITCFPFKPQSTWDVLQTLSVTDFAAAPTVYRALRASDQAASLTSLERLSSAGEPLTPEVGAWTRERFGLDVHDHFGQTELGMTAGFAHHPAIAIAARPSTMGLALPGWDMRVLAHDRDEMAPGGVVGRLAVRIEDSPFFTFTGYGLDRDQLADRFTPDKQYYVTGDLATMDRDGLIHYSSRDDDVILMAGYRIGPFDVESVLLTHPLVVECAVVAAPDDVRGEVIHAFVVTQVSRTPEEITSLTEELQEWVRRNYGAHAYPRGISYVQSLPKTPSGKVQRSVLRASLATEARHE